MGKKTNASLKTEKQKPMKEEEYLKLVERLKESEEFLRIGYEAGDLGIWKNDLQTGAIEFDERARIHYGFDTLHTTLSEVTNRIHPEDLARVGSEIESATSANGSGKFATEYRVIHPDGSIHWLAIGVRVLFEGEGVQRRALVGYGITQDITARKQVEIELHESEEKFEALFYQAAMPAVLLEISNRLAVDVNTAFENLSGYSREEIIGKNPVQIGMAPTAETQKAFHEFQEKGSLFGVEGRFFTKTGESRDILINANMVKLGGHEYALITYQNITERKQAEKQVIQMKRLYATLSQVNQTIVRVTDRTDLYQSICDVSTKFGEFALAWIGLLNEANGEVMPVAASGLDLAHWPFPQININEGIFKNGLIATALLTSKVVTSEDIVTDERTKSSQAALINHDYHAAAIVPFQLRGKTIGMLSLISHDANLFKQQDEVLLLKEM
ncbi:MAG: PAS domain S-box protein, partial [Anaerolineales bacterium]